MNAVPQIATRSTSIDQLPDSSAPPAAVAPVVLSAPPLASGMVGAVPGADAGQSSGVAGPSDSELVNDILQEINQSNAAKQAGGVVDANSVTQQQHTNDSAFARQMDPNMNRDIPAVTPQQADNYAAAGKATFVSILGLERARAQARMLADQAIQHLDLFDERADLLRQAAHFVITRRN